MLPYPFDIDSMPPTMLEDYWPFSCVGILYKLIANILSNRMVAVLPSLTSSNQTAFLEGDRLIIDNINLTQVFIPMGSFFALGIFD